MTREQVRARAPEQERRRAGANSAAVEDPTFWQEHGDEVSAAITMVVATVIALAVDRFVIGRAARYAAQVTEAGTSRAAQTRLRLIRRLVFVVILLIGSALALSQFEKLEKLATGLLASSAVLGLVLGLAARQVLANPIAGILLAVTQPIRIGDMIEIEEESGRVADLTLSYTFVDGQDGRLMVVPNETVVTSVLFNRSTGDRAAPAKASVWLPAGTDLGRARQALEALELSSVDVAELTSDGVRLEVHGRSDPARTVMEGEEAALRERSHEVLREAGLLGAE